MQPADVVRRNRTVAAVRLAGGDPFKLFGQNIEHGLGDNQILFGLPLMDLDALGGKDPGSPGIAGFGALGQPGVPDGVPGGLIHRAGNGQAGFFLEAHDRLQGALAKHAVHHQLGQKFIGLGQLP